MCPPSSVSCYTVWCQQIQVPRESGNRGPLAKWGRTFAFSILFWFCFLILNNVWCVCVFSLSKSNKRFRLRRALGTVAWLSRGEERKLRGFQPLLLPLEYTGNGISQGTGFSPSLGHSGAVGERATLWSGPLLSDVGALYLPSLKLHLWNCIDNTYSCWT